MILYIKDNWVNNNALINSKIKKFIKSNPEFKKFAGVESQNFLNLSMGASKINVIEKLLENQNKFIKNFHKDPDMTKLENLEKTLSIKIFQNLKKREKAIFEYFSKKIKKDEKKGFIIEYITEIGRHKNCLNLLIKHANILENQKQIQILWKEGIITYNNDFFKKINKFVLLNNDIKTLNEKFFMKYYEEIDNSIPINVEWYLSSLQNISHDIPTNGNVIQVINPVINTDIIPVIPLTNFDNDLISCLSESSTVLWDF